MRTLSVALTGGIGCSKTLLSRVFSHLHIPVFNTDDRAKTLYSNKNVLENMQQMFGTEIVRDGVLDKKMLSAIVFNDRGELEKLNKYIHPKVQEDFLQWKEEQTKTKVPYVVLESALIFETHWENMFDKIICINTPSHLAVQRAMVRDKATKEQILERIANQMPTEEKLKRSDYIIENDDIQLVIPQILSIDKNLKKLSEENYKKQ
mgnify:CR=1 FL=1